MASFIARRAFSMSARRMASTGEQIAGEQALKNESKKNPEIVVRQIPRWLESRRIERVY
jgi:hypothetical protein